MSIRNIVAKKVLPKETYDRIWRRRNWKKYSNRFETAIQHFVIEKSITDSHAINCWRKKLVDAFVKDNWYPDEYFFFNYEHLSRKGIHEFVSNREANLFWNFMNSKELYLLTCDKWLTYQSFKDYFHREVVAVSKNQKDSFEAFGEFVDKHTKFIVKPTFGNYGNGVQVIDCEAKAKNDTLIKELMESYPEGFTAEELIVQSDELGVFHPSSVNTIRITTARQSNGEVYIIHTPFIRLGQGGRCVDNGGNGGIIAAIDYDTGIIKGAIDERMNRYVVHPDTGKTILGYKIPKWEEAKAFAVELASVLPELRYCGWDIALTDQGWVMVEANGKGLFIGFQMPTQEGFRDEFEDIKKRCGYKG